MAASVVCGAVIVNTRGTDVTYKEKCESCGYVSGSTKHAPINSSRNMHSTFSSSFMCPKCHKRQEVKIAH